MMVAHPFFPAALTLTRETACQDMSATPAVKAEEFAPAAANAEWQPSAVPLGPVPPPNSKSNPPLVSYPYEDDEAVANGEVAFDSDADEFLERDGDSPRANALAAASSAAPKTKVKPEPAASASSSAASAASAAAPAAATTVAPVAVSVDDGVVRTETDIERIQRLVEEEQKALAPMRAAAPQVPAEGAARKPTQMPADDDSSDDEDDDAQAPRTIQMSADRVLDASQCCASPLCSLVWGQALICGSRVVWVVIAEALEEMMGDDSGGLDGEEGDTNEPLRTKNELKVTCGFCAVRSRGTNRCSLSCVKTARRSAGAECEWSRDSVCRMHFHISPLLLCSPQALCVCMCRADAKLELAGHVMSVVETMVLLLLSMRRD
jgi:hypothetical protein